MVDMPATVVDLFDIAPMEAMIGHEFGENPLNSGLTYWSAIRYEGVDLTTAQEFWDSRTPVDGDWMTQKVIGGHSNILEMSPELAEQFDAWRSSTLPRSDVLAIPHSKTITRQEAWELAIGEDMIRLSRRREISSTEVGAVEDGIKRQNRLRWWWAMIGEIVLARIEKAIRWLKGA